MVALQVLFECLSSPQRLDLKEHTGTSSSIIRLILLLFGLPAGWRVLAGTRTSSSSLNSNPASIFRKSSAMLKVSGWSISLTNGSGYLWLYQQDDIQADRWEFHILFQRVKRMMRSDDYDDDYREFHSGQHKHELFQTRRHFEMLALCRFAWVLIKNWRYSRHSEDFQAQS